MVFEIEPIRFEHKFPLETVVDGFYRKYPHPCERARAASRPRRRGPPSGPSRAHSRGRPALL